MLLKEILKKDEDFIKEILGTTIIQLTEEERNQ